MAHWINQLLTILKRHHDACFSLVLSLLLTIGIISPAFSFGAVQEHGGQEERTLEPDKPLEGELKGGSHHSYRVVLITGQYLHVVVLQQGIDLVVTLRDPNGATLSEMDGLQWPSGKEELSYEAAITGRYVVEVRAKGEANNSGGFELKIQRSETTNQQDRARIAAERLYMQAIRLAGQARGAGLEHAIKKYEEAIEQWRAAGVRKWEGQSLSSLGTVYRNLNQYEKALDLYDQALVIMREIDEKERKGAVLHNLGITYSSMGQYEKARQFYDQAVAIWRDIGNRNAEALVLNGLGIVYWRLSKHETARQYYEQTLAIWRETKNRQGEGQTLSGLGLIYQDLSQNEKAREYQEQSLQIMREIKDRDGEGRALNNLGELSRGLKQFEKAREFYEQALAIMRELTMSIT